MKPLFLSATTIIFIALLLCLSGCRNTSWRGKNDAKPPKNAILMSDSEVMGFNDFRTIDASMAESSGASKKNKSWLWGESQTPDIERRLGVQN